MQSLEIHTFYIRSTSVSGDHTCVAKVFTPDTWSPIAGEAVRCDISDEMKTWNNWEVSCQFGTFPFGAFHNDAMPVWRVSLWHDASLARVTLARFPFVCLCWSSKVWNLVSAKASLARTAVARVANLFVRMFPFYEEALSTPVCNFHSAKASLARSVSICVHVSFLRRSVVYASFFAHISFVPNYRAQKKNAPNWHVVIWEEMQEKGVYCNFRAHLKQLTKAL